ncbi:hypothetical protein KSC_024220 [Ktedonobacter sp. SOSP1-52]|uniref:hypothetical protein n=1 Tax=Ktedonobacter sp. SOSP1-52 TaxID=2778366 RepID=UPI001916A837|nr:hypothetical protein [Ktedonobacter sp. SOSP1-52]GHO63530.1 hypothetical protein KSC_024220 [Ktedonobacter sp. SOSP1-52]
MQQLQFSIISTGLCITAVDGAQVSLNAVEAFELADFIQMNRKTLYTLLREAAGEKEKILLVDTDALSAPALCQQIMSYLALGRQEITSMPVIEAGKATLHVALAGLMTDELKAWLDAAKAQGLCTGYRVLDPLPSSMDEPDSAASRKDKGAEEVRPQEEMRLEDGEERETWAQ